MRVETAHSGTELVTFGSIAAVVLSGVLPWVAGGAAVMPVAAALTVVCGLAAFGVVRDGRDHGALLALGLTVTALALRSVARFSADGGGFAGASRSPGIGAILAVLAGIALTGVAAHECWNEVAVEAESAEPTG
jgi:hypothetical protein